MQATTRAAPDSCASASSVEMPMSGRPRASARPCARPQAMRSPVNAPGPAPKATASRFDAVVPQFLKRVSSMGRASSECRLPARRSIAAISPSLHSATEHHSVEVSIAAKRMRRFYILGHMREHSIAVIPGDGIGREVIPECVRVLEAVGARHGLRFKWQEFPWSCDWYKAQGSMCPDDAPDILRRFDAIYFGAAGNPAIVPDHISAWGLLINFRRWFDLYVNLRPVRLFEGLPCPLAGRKPGDIDYIVIRENTEGEYGNIGGRVFENTPNEMVTQQAVFTRKGVDRIMKYSFELARTRKKHLTSCTKSNGISITMPYWDERFAEMRKKYPDVRADQYHVDGLTIQMVLNPDRFDVIVASNLFGDILSDLGPATAGTIGIAASGNINPERTAPSIFEPVHGSAPDIAGKKIANPIAQIWSGALMLEHLGHAAAAADVVRAIEQVIIDGPHTPDMKGKANTSEVGAAIAEAVRSASPVAA